MLNEVLKGLIKDPLKYLSIFPLQGEKRASNYRVQQCNSMVELTCFEEGSSGVRLGFFLNLSKDLKIESEFAFSAKQVLNL